MAATIVSCPGKVLIAGGYLVLDPAYQGLAISTPSRFYTVVQPLDKEDDEASAEVLQARESFEIEVRSPQFSDGRWRYTATKGSDDEWAVTAGEAAGPNPFVQLSIASALSLAAALSPSLPRSSLRVTILGSNDFYSQSRDASGPPPPFQPLNVPISKAHKTGLGSSAAMVSSLTSALLFHWTREPLTPATTPKKATLDLVHNLAQYVHSLAQGKIGSGFDVSAAVCGSQVYRRFAPENLDPLLALPAGQPVPSKTILDNLSPLVNSAWSHSASAALVSPFGLPPGTTLILADVDAGSNTPSMVGKVNKWRQENAAEAEELWTTLKDANDSLAECFGALSRDSTNSAQSYQTILDTLGAAPSTEWSKDSDTAASFLAAREHILAARALMRKMGQNSSVDIEPESQTALLDGVSALPGVVGAGVPGAGGYDAIWVLVISSPTREAAVAAFLTKWQGTRDGQAISVRPLSEQAWGRGGTAESERGLLRVAGVDEVEGLAAVLKGL